MPPKPALDDQISELLSAELEQQWSDATVSISPVAIPSQSASESTGVRIGGKTLP